MVIMVMLFAYSLLYSCYVNGIIQFPHNSIRQ